MTSAQEQEHTPTPIPQQRPNFLVIVTDDQNYDDMIAMPKTRELVFNAGISFEKGYVTTPWCCPSRSTIFTGLYVSKHGVESNTDELTVSTVAEHLHDSGYLTGIVGKYLNSWPGTPRKEYDYWRVFAGGNERYRNPRFNENGTWHVKDGYITHVMRDYMLEFIKLAAESDKPFLAYWTPNAPHRPATPEQKYENAFRHIGRKVETEHDQSTCFSRSRKDKPRYIRKSRCNTVEAADFYRRQLQTLLTVDDVIAELIKELATQGLLENTVVFFISDNGLMRGAFGLSGKPYPYEPCVKVPFAVRYDKLSPSTRVFRQLLVGNYDIAPTIYELAQVAPPYAMDGQSLVPVLDGTVSDGDGKQWRPTLMFESFTERILDNTWKQPFVSITDGQDTLIVTKGEPKIEIYDLVQDPKQIRNRYRMESKQIKARVLFQDMLLARPDIISAKWLHPSAAEYLGIAGIKKTSRRRSDRRRGSIQQRSN